MSVEAHQILLDSARKLLHRDAKKSLARLLSRTRPADIAHMLRNLSERESIRLLRAIPDTELRALVLVEAVPEVQRDVLSAFSDDEVVEILDEAAADDAADILDLLSEERRDTIIAAISGPEGDELDALLNFDPESAGGIMSPDVFALPDSTTVAEAIATLQTSHEELEMVFYLYVVGDLGQLTGVCSLRQLVVSSPDELLADICEVDVVRVTTSTDQEEVARLVARYNFLAIPVVDDGNRLVGIVTVDDIIDVIREEATEDMFRMAGAGSTDLAEQSSVWNNVRTRMPWLLASFGGGIGSLLIISRFEEAVIKVAALAAFIPITIGMGGNVGTQSATIMVRGLALKRFDGTRFFSIVGREIAIGVIGGFGYGLLVALVAVLLYRNAAVGEPWNVLQLAATIALAVAACMTLAATVGAAVPFLFDRFGIDPAVATGPIVTTTVDIAGVAVFFTIAIALLPM